MASCHPPMVQELGLSNVNFELDTQTVVFIFKSKGEDISKFGAIIQDYKAHTHLLFFKLLCRVYFETSR